MLGTCVLVAVVVTASVVGIWPPTKPRSFLTTKRPLRVQDGEEDSTGKHPYVVAVLKNDKQRVCTGIMIAPTWTLIAAHCTRGIFVQYGDMTVPRENITQISEIQRQIPHPNYKAYRYSPRKDVYNDIGLCLVLEIKLDTYGKLSALDYNAMIGYKVEYAGYGLTSITNKQAVASDHQKPLQLGTGMVFSCHDVQMMLFYYPKICIAPQCSRRQSMLPGDSGGPLFVDGKVVGINVAIIHEPKISVCTPISPYITWIQQITRDEANAF